MPLRNGKVVPWKLKIDEFRDALGNDNFSDEKRLLGLAELIDQHKEVFSNGYGDYGFAQDLREVVEVNSGTDDLENEGNYVINKIYDYADRHLIWLGI